MGWFDDQIKLRKQIDNDNFADAIDGIAGAVMGTKLAAALDDDETISSAIDEILKYYHCKPRKDELPANVKTVDERLEYCMRPFGIMRRTVLLDEEWYKNAVGAMLGTFKEDGSVVALIPDKISGYYFRDIKTGQRTKVNKKTVELIDDEAVCFYQPFPLRKLKMADLWQFMLRQRTVADIVMYFGMMGAVAALGLISPMLTSWLFGDVLESGSIRVLVALAGFMLCYSISKMLVSAFQSFVNSRITTKQNVAVQAAVMSRMMTLPPRFFREYSAGDLNQRANYVQSLCATLMNSIGTTGISSLFSLIYIGQVFVYAPSLVVPSLVITITTVVMNFITTIMRMQSNREYMQSASKTSGMTYSMITGIQKIKLAGAEKRMFARWAKNYAKESIMQYNPPTLLKIGTTINLAVSLIGALFLYYIAVKNNVSVSDYYAFNSAYGMVSGAFMSFSSIAMAVANIKPTLEMAKPILDAEPEVAVDKEIITSLSGGIELNNVSFRYDESMPNVIDDLTLKIRSGEYVAIVGSTGCGKSTLLRLLLGFEKPQKGAIYYDGKDISRVDVKSLRRRIGTVMQDGKLFLGDIYSNIVISAPQLTLDEAWEAAEIASVADDIRAMPMGMNTLISEGQGGISGGQKQRLMIARAVAPKPKILMFDEATSALDNVTQKKVSEAIDSLKCTRIVIAHRLSTIRHCDRIIVLDKGKIIEDGKYEELIAQNGFFAELVERQRLDV